MKIEAEEESEDDDSISSQPDEDDSVNDPLEEVDLDNILPIRTRRRVPLRPGFCIANNPGNGRVYSDS